MRVRKRLTKYSVLFLLLSVSFGCREEILHDLDEVKANQVQLLLARADIAAAKDRSGALWNIAVPGSAATRALAVLENSRLLTREAPRFKEQTKGFIETHEEKMAAVERELAWTLEQTLERIPGVLEARIQFHLAAVDLPFSASEKTTGSAGVLLLLSDRASFDEGQVRELVSGSAGLPPASITVIFSRLGDSTAQNDSDVRGIMTPGFTLPAPTGIPVFGRLPANLCWMLLILAAVLLLLRLRSIIKADREKVPETRHSEPPLRPPVQAPDSEVEAVDPLVRAGELLRERSM